MQPKSSPESFPSTRNAGSVAKRPESSPSPASTSASLLDELRSIHFVGIGGIGMSGMARVLLQLGYEISGSDLKPSSITDSLQELGATIHIGHAPFNVNGAELLVCSSAVPQDNVEILRASEKKIPIVHRSQMLAALMQRQRGIGIAGTHGKSTTTSMIALVLERAGYDPTVVVGGELNDIGGNAKLGGGDFFVAEADESDGSLLNLKPERAVVTNVETDHLDYYGTEDRLIETFRQFLLGLKGDGLAVACAECGNVAKVLSQKIAAPVATYGFNENADYRAHSCEHRNGGVAFEVTHRRNRIGQFRLSIPGRHNVLNALATIAMTESLGVARDQIREILPQYKGIRRRWQTVAEVNDVRIVDDYAHHPTEVKATLSAARAGSDRRIIAVFQPHRYSRTQYLGEEFGKAFGDADHVIICDVYSALEKPIPGVSGEIIANAVRRDTFGKPVEYIPDKEQIPERLAELVRPGDLVVTLGAGDIYQVGRSLAQRLES